jgi:hypothetical protein
VGRRAYYRSCAGAAASCPLFYHLLDRVFFNPRDVVGHLGVGRKVRDAAS